MKNLSPQAELANRHVMRAKDLGISQVSLDSISKDGKTIKKNGNEIKYFTSCSYVGLENDARLKQGAMDALENYGVQFSSSRAFLEIPLYAELESLLSQIFGKPTLLAPTTTLGHMSLIPLFIGSKDAVILDQQVHNSIQTTIGLAKSTGTHVEIVRHNRIDLLEEKINELRLKYEKVWYMADGVYSMLGDLAPINKLHELMDQYDNFYCYIDDAHGMSWTGGNGAGHVFNKKAHHDKMIFITTLAKGFGVAGSAMVFPNEEMKNLVRNISPALMFSGPIQPPNLGALIASAKIHLSDEIYERQEKVHDLITYFNMTARGFNLPLVNTDLSPIFFIGVGTPDVGFDICKKMLDSGYYLNIAAFPAVPFKNTGLRVTVTHHQNVQDIYEMLETLAKHFGHLESKNHIVRNEIHKAFSLAN